MTRRRKSKSWKIRHRRGNRAAVEVEGNCAVEIGAVNADTRFREPAQCFDSWQAKRIARSHRDNRKLGVGGGYKFPRRGIVAAMMSNLQQIGYRMLGGDDAPLDAFFGISFQKNRGFSIAHAHNQGVIVLRL